MKLPYGVNERTIAGAGIFVLSVAIIALIAFKPDIADNELFGVLAQAIIVQGLVGLTMAYWFQASKDRGDGD